MKKLCALFLLALLLCLSQPAEAGFLRFAYHGSVSLVKLTYSSTAVSVKVAAKTPSTVKKAAKKAGELTLKVVW